GQWFYARFDKLEAHLAVAQVIGRTVSFFLFDQGDPQALVRAGKARMPPVGAHRYAIHIEPGLSIYAPADMPFGPGKAHLSKFLREIFHLRSAYANRHLDKLLSVSEWRI